MKNHQKLIKQSFNIVLIITLLLASISLPKEITYAKTLGDLKVELQKTIDEYNEAQQNKNLTQQQINAVKANIQNTIDQINNSQTEISDLSNEIEELNKNIQTKKNQIKEIISFYQISGSNSANLDYIMGAKTFTDFIYRVAISEQLIQYNDDLVNEYNSLIEQNKQKQTELKDKIKSLEEKQKSLQEDLNSLGTQMNQIVDVTVDIEEEIAVQKQAIKMYEEQYGCKDNDDLDVCTKGQLPPDTSFWRPLESGRRTSEYGYRSSLGDFHTGIDLSANGAKVYSSANGVVAGIVRKSSCGGNKIYIHHKVNGVTYTTGYHHLRTILVNVGDTVTKDTVIAISGGNPRIETWDKCSTGPHLHFSVAYGLYLSDYKSWSTFISKTVDPRKIVNFPAGSGQFTNRTTKY
ncbi:MAG: peptidoglycan DD-metalloendopeptidase family protein [Clostridium sp.]|nr:peptidoglycan DD-metalloendopeptidase family protein [Clostridium sp.]MCM1443932.1 peptidoglycan DD-metalloendopeptidase family protein [Candidatus Amulumruptor caecigallinarius]